MIDHTIQWPKYININFSIGLTTNLKVQIARMIDRVIVLVARNDTCASWPWITEYEYMCHNSVYWLL